MIAKIVAVKGAEIVQPPAVLDAVLSGDLHFLPPIDPSARGGKGEVGGRLVVRISRRRWPRGASRASTIIKKQHIDLIDFEDSKIVDLIDFED